MMRYKHKKYSGFTLIEMMVVIAIITIMTSILLVTLSKDRSKKELEVAGRMITAGLREAQNNALTGKKHGADRSCSFQFALSANGYIVKADTYNSTIEDGCPANATYEDFGSQRTFEKGIIATAKDVIFQVPHGGVEIGGASITGTEAITIKKGDDTYYVCLNPSGRIEEVGFSSTGCN